MCYLSTGLRAVEISYPQNIGIAIVLQTHYRHKLLYFRRIERHFLMEILVRDYKFAQCSN